MCAAALIVAVLATFQAPAMAYSAKASDELRIAAQSSSDQYNRCEPGVRNEPAFFRCLMLNGN